jgi:transposase
VHEEERGRPRLLREPLLGQALCEGRSLTPGKAPGKKPLLDEKARRLLEADVQERPFAKLRHGQVNLEQGAGVSVSESTLSRAIRRMVFDRIN